MAQHEARTPLQVDDPFPAELVSVGDCPAEYVAPFGMIAFCLLDDGHEGQHVATDGQRVVAVWP